MLQFPCKFGFIHDSLIAVKLQKNITELDIMVRTFDFMDYLYLTTSLFFDSLSNIIDCPLRSSANESAKLCENIS